MKKLFFAQEAKEEDIESVPDVQTEENENNGVIGYQHGFDKVHPPRIQQLNQILKDITSITRYSVMGGLYGIDQEIIQFGGYPKNSLICVDEVGIFRSLVNNNTSNNINDRNRWKLLIDFKSTPKYQRVIGEYFYSSCLDKEFMFHNGAVLCDGSQYNVDLFEGLREALTQNKIRQINYNEYDYFRNTFGSCPYIGWNGGNDFRAPFFNGELFVNPGYITNNPSHAQLPLDFNRNLPFRVHEGYWDKPGAWAKDQHRSGVYWQGRDYRNFFSVVHDINNNPVPAGFLKPKSAQLSMYIVMDKFFPKISPFN